MPAWALIDDHGRVDAVQRADRLADEVGIAGRVDEFEVLAAVVEMRDVASIE